MEGKFMKRARSALGVRRMQMRYVVLDAQERLLTYYNNQDKAAARDGGTVLRLAHLKSVSLDGVPPALTVAVEGEPELVLQGVGVDMEAWRAALQALVAVPVAAPPITQTMAFAAKPVSAHAHGSRKAVQPPPPATLPPPPSRSRAAAAAPASEEEYDSFGPPPPMLDSLPPALQAYSNAARLSERLQDGLGVATGESFTGERALRWLVAAGEAGEEDAAVALMRSLLQNFLIEYVGGDRNVRSALSEYRLCSGDVASRERSGSKWNQLETATRGSRVNLRTTMFIDTLHAEGRLTAEEYRVLTADVAAEEAALRVAAQTQDAQAVFDLAASLLEEEELWRDMDGHKRRVSPLQRFQAAVRKVIFANRFKLAMAGLAPSASSAASTSAPTSTSASASALASSEAAAATEEEEEARPSRVQFGDVVLRHHVVTVGTSCPADGGPSIGLGDELLDTVQLGVDEFEAWREEQQHLDMFDYSEMGKLTPERRAEMLLSAGHRRVSVDLSQFQMRQLHRSRRSSARSKGARMVMDGQSPEDVMEWEARMRAEELCRNPLLARLAQVRERTGTGPAPAAPEVPAAALPTAAASSMADLTASMAAKPNRNKGAELLGKKNSRKSISAAAMRKKRAAKK